MDINYYISSMHGLALLLTTFTQSTAIFEFFGTLKLIHLRHINGSGDGMGKPRGDLGGILPQGNL